MTKTIPLSLWTLVEDKWTRQGWRPYGYEPMPSPSVVNLIKEDNMDDIVVIKIIRTNHDFKEVMKILKQAVKSMNVASKREGALFILYTEKGITGNEKQALEDIFDGLVLLFGKD